MKTTFSVAAASLAGLLFVAGAHAQQKDQERAPRADTAGVYKAADLINLDVKNQQGEDLGEIEDIVIDVESGDIVYIAVEHGATLGVGGKLFAVPPGALKLSEDATFFRWEVRKQDLEGAQGFNKDAWPDRPDERWGKGIGGQKGEQPLKEAAREAKEAARDVKEAAREAAGGKKLVMRVSGQLKGTDVKNPQGEDLGEIEGAALDLNKHKVVYYALGYGGVAGVGEKYFAIPPQAFKYEPQNRTFTLKAAKADFENQPGFDTDRWPTEADKRFMKLGEGDQPRDQKRDQ